MPLTMVNDDNRRNIHENYIEQVPPKPPVKPQLKRSIRKHRPFQKYSPHEYVMITNGEPEYNQKTMNYEQRRWWLKAMEKIKLLHENRTIELVELSKDKRALKNTGVQVEDWREKLIAKIQGTVGCKILDTILNHPIRDISYRTIQKLVRFNYEKWSEIPNRSKNAISYRYVSVHFARLGPSSGLIRVKQYNHWKGKKKFVILWARYRAWYGIVRYRTVRVDDRYGPRYRFNIPLLVVKGFGQKKHIDFEKKFSLVV